MSGEIRWDAERREAEARELFDTANRVQFAEFLEKKAARSRHRVAAGEPGA